MSTAQTHIHFHVNPTCIGSESVYCFIRGFCKISCVRVEKFQQQQTIVHHSAVDMERPLKRKKKTWSPESQLRHDLECCIKAKDLRKAFSIYEEASAKGFKLNPYTYNALLYLCSSAAEMEESRELAIEKGFHLYENMLSSDVAPTEATLTAVARLAGAKNDGDLAFQMVKKMVELNLEPRLRSYSPALMAFCRCLQADKAYEMDEFMLGMGVQPEVEELEALLRVSVKKGRQEKVYSLLQRIRVHVKEVSESTCEVIEQWFRSEAAAAAGQENWDEGAIRLAVISRGGGWHGQGWLGTGAWNVQKTGVSFNGDCQCCGHRLALIDTEVEETEKFARSLEDFACSRENSSNFKDFREWLDQNGPYEFIVDGANVGLFAQNFVEGGFSFSQLSSIVNELQKRNASRRFLIVMHNRRARGGPANIPENKQLINEWIESKALYTTPSGSNDDWYWLYAAVKFKCFLVTNDEMRDHLFALLGSEFFPRWKEKHQVHFTFKKSDPDLHMPPTYSIAIQESQRGSWHIPIRTADDSEESRVWLCVARGALL